jgi:hypothetical protein
MNYKLQLHSELSQNNTSKEGLRIASSEIWLAKTFRRSDAAVSGKLKRGACEEDAFTAVVLRSLVLY